MRTYPYGTSSRERLDKVGAARMAELDGLISPRHRLAELAKDCERRYSEWPSKASPRWNLPAVRASREARRRAHTHLDNLGLSRHAAFAIGYRAGMVGRSWFPDLWFETSADWLDFRDGWLLGKRKVGSYA